MLFNEMIDKIKASLTDKKGIEIVIGIPFYNENDTLKHVVEIAQKSFKHNDKKLIVCVGDPAGKEAIKNLRENFGNSIVSFLMPSGINGRGYSIRAILELARFFESNVVLLEADLNSRGDTGINPEWVENMANPVLQNYDLSVACFKRHPFEDTIGSLLVSPIIAALYKTKFRDPLSGVFAISHKLVKEFCCELDHAIEYVGGYGINPWIITTALKWDKKICEVNLGPKLTNFSMGKKYIVAKQMLNSLFKCIKRDEEFWLDDIDAVKTLDECGIVSEDKPLNVDCNYKELLDSFLEGICHYHSLLKKVFDKESIEYIENMAKLDMFPSFLPKKWSRIVLKSIQAYSFNTEINQRDLLELLLVLYDGITASFIKQTKDSVKGFENEKDIGEKILSAVAQAAYQDTVTAFTKNRKKFIKEWQNKLSKTNPVITPLDYLEFIPGVPIVLPKKLLGRGQREVATGQVFKRLQKKYNEAFWKFMDTLNIDKKATSKDIENRLTSFLNSLEKTIDNLCPGDLFSVEGTGEVVDNIFRIVPHNKVLAVKWQMLRKLLYENPPWNLILRKGYRNLRELLENMNERDILTLALFTEDKDYFDKIFYWLKDNMRPDSFEEVEIKPIIVNRNNFHSSSEIREISDLNRLTARIPVMNLGKGMGGNYPKLRYFARIAKSIVEAEHFSDLWKNYAKERKEIGRKFVNSILGHYGKAMFSAHHIFENWHHRVLTSKLEEMAQSLREKKRETDALNIETMIKGYGLSLVLEDGTFIPCSAWTWASFSFKGGEGIPTPLFTHVERDWFNHDLLEEIYREMGRNPAEIMQRVFQYISQGRESIDLAKALLGVKSNRQEVIIQEFEYWPKAKELKRYDKQPILEPIKEHWWENRFVLNCGALRIKDKVYLLYRAFGEDGISRIGLAISEGYKIIDRLKQPIFVPETREEIKGCEDPRTVIIDDEIFMLYTAYDGVVAQIAAASISLQDFVSGRFDRWKRRGLAFPGLWDKDAILFPEKIDGKYVIYHRIEPSIWMAYSEKLAFPWPRSGHKIVMGPRSGMMWDSLKIGAGAQPIKTRFGWLLIYHGVDQGMVYRLGVMLADLKDPGRLLYRSPNPILSPETECEIGRKDECWVPNVVFTCGAVPKEDKEILDVDDEILVYYGAADTNICLATGTVGELIPKEVRDRIDNRKKYK